MKRYYSDVIQFKGDHYDFGLKQGELLKDSPILQRREKQWKTRRKRDFIIHEQEAIGLFSTFHPSMLDELQGLADALQWTMKDALREFGGYYLEYVKSGCSIVTGSEFMIRNYDSHPRYYEGRYVIYQPTDDGYATIGPSMQITGRTDGMNEKGLAMGYNFINRIGRGDGFLCNMIGRLILETCANVDEAIALLKEIPHRTTFSYVLTDPCGETYVVEASPRKVIARRSNVSTNHFEVLTEENRNRTGESIRRQKEIEHQKQHGMDVYEAYQILNNEERDVFSNKYDASAGTIHTSAYLPREGKAFFAIGGNRMPVIFDFNQYLQGKKLHITQIKGMLEYHEPFVNMDEASDEH